MLTHITIIPLSELTNCYYNFSVINYNRFFFSTNLLLKNIVIIDVIDVFDYEITLVLRKWLVRANNCDYLGSGVGRTIYINIKKYEF